ncbi:thymidine kinase, partial [Leuconostoc pseudomesenteroides]
MAEMNEQLKKQFFVDQLSQDQERVIGDINDYIGTSVANNNHAVAIIQGAAGTGKSVVLMDLVTKYMTDKRYKTALV